MNGRTVARWSGYLVLATLALAPVLTGPLIDALHDPGRLKVLNNVVLRQRADFTADLYRTLALRRLAAIAPFVAMLGITLVFIGSPRARRWFADPRSIDSTRLALLDIDRVAPFALVLLSLGLRMGTIVRPSTIAWDENTFLTIGERLALGELPFTTTFDNKPPLAAVFNAAPLLVAPGNLGAVRLALAVVIGIAAIAIHRLGRTAGGGPGMALAGAVAFIVASTIGSGGGAWMTQHSANLLFAWLLLGTIRVMTEAPSRMTGFGLGLLAAATVLTRTNYAIPVAAALVTMTLLTARRDGPRTALSIAAGGIAMVGALIATYATAGALDPLRRALIDLPLAQGHLGAAVGGDRLPPGALGLVTLHVGLVILALVHGRGGSDGPAAQDRVARSATLVIGAAALGAAASVALHGIVYDHHVHVLTVPVAAQLALTRVPHASSRGRPSERRLAMATAGAIVVLAVVAAVGLGAQYGLPTPDDARHAREAEVVQELEQRLLGDPGSLWALDHHYVYWRLGVLPVDRGVVHPSTVEVPAWWTVAPWPGSRVPESTDDALAALLDLEPGYLVSSVPFDEWYLADEAVDLARFQERVARDYDVVWISDDGKVAIRRLRPADTAP